MLDLPGKGLRPMLVVGIGLAVFQQIVGINTVIYYTPTIFKYAGVSTSASSGQTVFVGVTNVVFTIAAVLLLDKLGRRVFLIIRARTRVLADDRGDLPLKARSSAMATCTIANWGFNFLVSFTFLQLVATAGKGGAFFTYAALGIAAIVFFAWKVPETKGRSLEEIESDLGADDAVGRDDSATASREPAHA